MRASDRERDPSPTASQGAAGSGRRGRGPRAGSLRIALVRTFSTVAHPADDVRRAQLTPQATADHRTDLGLHVEPAGPPWPYGRAGQGRTRAPEEVERGRVACVVLPRGDVRRLSAGLEVAPRLRLGAGQPERQLGRQAPGGSSRRRRSQPRPGRSRRRSRCRRRACPGSAAMRPEAASASRSCSRMRGVRTTTRRWCSAGQRCPSDGVATIWKIASSQSKRSPWMSKQPPTPRPGERS